MIAFDRTPGCVDAGAERVDRFVVVDHIAGAGALGFRRKLGVDHRERLGTAQAAIAHEPLEPHVARGVDQEDRVHIVDQPCPTMGRGTAFPAGARPYLVQFGNMYRAVFDFHRKDLEIHRARQAHRLTAWNMK